MTERALAATRRLLATFGALLLAGGAWGQTTSSSLIGTVRDLDGKPAEGAIVQARSAATGVERTGEAARDGRYRIDLLQPGTWTVVARRADGEASESRNVVLRLQQTTKVDLTIGKGLSEQVTVRATAPLVDTSRTQDELRVGEDQVETLPIAGRSVTDLALLDASVQATPPGGFYGERGAVFVVDGQSGRANSYLVDGLDNNDRTSSTTLNSYFSPLVIKEFVVLTARYAAEFGRAGGGVLNIVTEQGSNIPSGEMFFQGSAATLSSPGSFVSSLPSRGQGEGVGHSYGLGFKQGGAFVPDRAFYFAAYERNRTDAITPYVGTDRDGIPGGWVEAPSDDDNVFLRTDFNLTPSQFLMVRVSADSRKTDDLNVGGMNTPEAGFQLDEHDVQLATSLTSVITPSVLNEARLLLSTSAFDQFANSSRPGVDRPLGSFGGNNLNRQLRDENKFQVVDNLTWRIGSHTTKFGVDVTRSRTHIATRFNPNGNFTYDTDAPFNPGDCVIFNGDVVQAIENGTYPRIPCPSGSYADIGTYPVYYQYIVGQPNARLYDTQLGLFAQDTWRIGSKFLLDYGLRYDVSTFQLPATAKVAPDPPVVAPPNGGAGVDRNNVAPRIGFTWTPGADGRLVVRGGGGVFYDKIPLGFPAVAAITSGTQIGIMPIQSLNLPITENTVEQNGGGQAILPYLFFPPQYILRFSTGTKLDTPYTTEASLGVEAALGRRGSASLDVTRAVGHHLPLMKDLNPTVPALAQCATGIDPLNPGIYLNTCDPRHEYRGIGSIAAIVTEGQSWYTGVTLGWRWRGETAWYQASYTWSRATDMGPDPLKGGIYLPQDSVHLSGEKGPTDFDRRHRIVFSWESGLPRTGLRASGVIQASSPLPFNVTTGRDNNLDGITTDRPLGVGRNSGVDTPLDIVNALREQENELRRLRDQPDLAPIGHLQAPTFFQVDFRVAKPFVFRDGKQKGEMYLQAINLFDRFNGGLVDGRVISPDFGKPILPAGPPRTVELGLKLGY